MKPLTFYTTLAAIIVGTGMVCNALLLAFVGLILAPIFLWPLYVTLFLSRHLFGTAIQLVLLSSTLLYFSYFVYWFYFLGHLGMASLLYAVPVMLGFWIAAGIIRLRTPRAQPSASADSSEPGRSV